MKLPDPLDFMAFILLNLRHHLKKMTDKTILSDFHRELCTLVEHQRVIVAAPRSFAKSSYFSFFYVLYMAISNPGIKIMVVSATWSLAGNWLRKIRLELETNKGLIARYGHLKGDKWRDDFLELANGVTIIAKGAGQQVRGERPALIVVDDIETEEIVSNPRLLEEFEEWFNKELIGTLEPDSQMVIVGMILHPESFLNMRIKYPPYGWKVRLYKAIKTDSDALWPEQWDLEALYRRKQEIGDRAFAQEYMNDPIRKEDMTFQSEWFRYIEDIKCEKRNEFGLPMQNYTYFTMVDLAIEQKKENDYTAIVTVGVDAQENIYVVNYVRKKMPPSKVVDTIFECFSTYSPACIGIESRGFQGLIKDDVERKRSERGLYPVISSLKDGGRHKHLRIEALQPRFQSGKIFHRRAMSELESELTRFPSPRCHDDLIDALAYSLDIIRPAKQNAREVNPKSFDAFLEKRKKRRVVKGVWGNHNLR